MVAPIEGEAGEAMASPRRRMSAADRRETIMRAAGSLFGRRGYAATRLDEIAAAAQVSKPIVYRHFDSKKALYMALLEKHQGDLPSFFDQAPAPSAGGSPELVLRVILEHWLDYVRLNQHAWLMLFRDSSGDAEIQALRFEVSRRAREVLVAYIAGEPRFAVPARQLAPTAEMLVSGLAGLALWWIDHPQTPKSLVVEVAVRVSTAALAG